MGQENPIAPYIMDLPSNSQDSASALCKEGNGAKSKEVRQPFPCKVYEMLEDAEEKGFDDIVSWNHNGDGFTVHNKDRFTKEIVPIYFNQTRYKSFQRQLSLYGFERSTTGSNKGLRHHEKLRRGFKHLCRQMKPVGYKPRGQEKIKEKKFAESTSSTITESTASEASTSPTSVLFSQPKQGIPTVVSSDSIYKENLVPPPSFLATVNDGCVMTQSTSRQSPNEITERLITTDYIATFEGMPFYLMTTIPSTPSCNSDKSTTLSPIQPPSTERDGSMKKAWDIGFAVAMTMKEDTSSFSQISGASFEEFNTTVWLDANDFYQTTYWT